MISLYKDAPGAWGRAYSFISMSFGLLPGVFWGEGSWVLCFGWGFFSNICLWNISKEGQEQGWDSSEAGHTPWQHPHLSFHSETVMPWLQNPHQTRALNCTPHLAAASASIPGRQHQASKSTILLQAVLSLICIPGSWHKKEFHSRELFQVCQHQCLLPTIKTHFLGASQLSVFQHNCKRHLEKCLTPGVKMCFFNRSFLIKLKVPDKLWVHVKAKDYEFKLLCTPELPNSCCWAVTGYSHHKNPRTTEFLSLQTYRGISILNPLITLRN